MTNTELYFTNIYVTKVCVFKIQNFEHVAILWVNKSIFIEKSKFMYFLAKRLLYWIELQTFIIRFLFIYVFFFALIFYNIIFFSRKFQTSMKIVYTVELFFFQTEFIFISRIFFKILPPSVTCHWWSFKIVMISNCFICFINNYMQQWKKKFRCFNTN